MTCLLQFASCNLHYSAFSRLRMKSIECISSLSRMSKYDLKRTVILQNCVQRTIEISILSPISCFGITVSIPCGFCEHLANFSGSSPNNKQILRRIFNQLSISARPFNVSKWHLFLRGRCAVASGRPIDHIRIRRNAINFYIPW